MIFHLLVEGHVPFPCFRAVAKDINGVVIALDLKISVGRRQPAILNFFNLDFSIAYPDSTGSFFSPVSGIALHFNFHRFSPTVNNDQTWKTCINMPFFLKSKAVFKVELMFLILNFSDAKQVSRPGFFLGLRLQSLFRQCLRKFWLHFREIQGLLIIFFKLKNLNGRGAGVFCLLDRYMNI